MQARGKGRPQTSIHTNHSSEIVLEEKPFARLRLPITISEKVRLIPGLLEFTPVHPNFSGAAAGQFKQEQSWNGSSGGGINPIYPIDGLCSIRLIRLIRLASAAAWTRSVEAYVKLRAIQQIGSRDTLKRFCGHALQEL